MRLRNVFSNGKLRNLCLLVGWCGCMALPVSASGAAPKSLSAHVLAMGGDDDDKVYGNAVVGPEFPGGVDSLLQYIKSHVRYPEEALKRGVQGRVFIAFVVGKDGAVYDAKVQKSPDSLLSREALRVVQSLPKWKPGMHEGKPVKVQYTLPIKFDIPDKGNKQVGTGKPIVPVVGDIEELDVYPISEVVPEFPGGDEAMMKYIGTHVRYPEELKKVGAEGRVMVGFVVDKSGSIRDIKVMESSHPLFSAEAVRVVQSMPKWKPGTQGGKPVNVQYSLPVIFRLKAKK